MTPKPRHGVEIRYHDPDRPEHIDGNVYWMSVGDHAFHFVARPVSCRKRGRAHIELTWDREWDPAANVPAPTVVRRP